jgi:6-phospho-3-hexuloisomerase
MSVTTHLRAILDELARNSANADGQQLSTAVREIIDARHIFLAGAGRSGVVITGFANRLIHLGKSVSLISEITCPHSTPEIFSSSARAPARPTAW